MPVYLKSIGFSVLLIGIFEGIAEAVAGLSKGYFGKLSDTRGKRLPFVQLGYALSAIGKSALAILNFPIWVAAMRAMDKLGKGVRTGARDALLSAETTKEHKGKIFGFNKAFDTIGAVAGPLLALFYLKFYPQDYKTLFLIAFLPGVVAVAFTFLVKEKKIIPVARENKVSFLSFLHYWKVSSVSYKKSVTGLVMFALVNSSDIFLLMMLKENGFSDQQLLFTYIFYNLVFAIFSFPLGALGDKIGLKKTLLIGLTLFSMVYFGMSFSREIFPAWVLFFLYGIYAAATDGISKAIVTNSCEAKDAATAIGTFTAFQSIATMLASFIAGILWSSINPQAVFIFSGTGCVLVIFYFLFHKFKKTKKVN